MGGITIRVHLEAIAAQPGSSLNIDASLDYSFADLGHGQSFASPVRIEGLAVNKAGILTLDYSAEFTLSLVCDRCLRGVERDFKESFSHTLSLTEPGEDSEAVYCPGGRLDLLELSVDDIFITLPRRVLCAPDCKGLCPVCGADLNTTDCGHGRETGGQKSGDPRWAALRNLNFSDDN